MQALRDLQGLVARGDCAMFHVLSSLRAAAEAALIRGDSGRLGVYGSIRFVRSVPVEPAVAND